MKREKNGFTLIELLAVIIILGILMIIAIPSVTSYINNSRKSAYVDSAREIIAGARNFVNEGKVEMYDTNVTYYIDYGCVKTENASKSPYGDFDKAYVIVTYDGKGYNYYWVSRDETGQGVATPVSINSLDEDDIKSDLAASDINTDIPIGSRKKTQIINSSCAKEEPRDADTTKAVPEGGNSGGNGGNTTPTPVSNNICKRATSLHTATCSRTDSYGCRGKNKYANGAKITYGNETTTSGKLTPGDAFDCDVNKDGTYDAATERFYYVSDYYDVNAETPGLDTSKATLIYYTNVTEGTTATQTNYAYFSSSPGQNNLGPRTLLDQLPSTTQWSNNQIVMVSDKRSRTRQITAETGATSTYGGTIESFTYTDKAARLLTTQELVAGCSSLSRVGSYTDGELDGCNYLMENVGQYETTSGTYGYWLESPRASESDNVWSVFGYRCRVNNDNANYASRYGVRPAITVLKSNIEY